MRSSSRKLNRRVRKDNSVKGNKLLPVIFIFLIIALFAIIFIFIKSQTRYWKGDRKLVLAVSQKSGDINVLVFDPQHKEIYDVVIPGNTEIEVARDLGVWKLRSVTGLGEDKEYGKKLLPESVTKSFKFPVFLSADEKALGLVGLSYKELVKAVILPYKTDLGLGDRLRIALFALGVNNSKHIEVDLTKTEYLKEVSLLDGEEGYKITSRIPENLAAIFTDSKISDNELKLKLINRSEDNIGVDTISGIINVLGGKITLVESELPSQFNCKINSLDQRTLELLNNLFKCEFDKSLDLGNFGAVVSIGEKFILK